MDKGESKNVSYCVDSWVCHVRPGDHSVAGFAQKGRSKNFIGSSVCAWFRNIYGERVPALVRDGEAAS